MENPFLLAIALWESREVTIRFLAGARENEPDSQVREEKPIDWRLLVDSTAQTEGAEGKVCNPTVAGCSSDPRARLQCSITPTFHSAESEDEVPRARVARFLRVNAFTASLFTAVNVESSTTNEQNLILDPWLYDRSPGTEVVQHATRNLCFQANGVSLLKAGRKSFEFNGAHVSLNRAGDSQTFTVGNSVVRGISIDVPDAWLKKFSLCDLVTSDGVGIRDPDLVFLARRIYEESVCGDVFSPMVVDALMVELLVSFVRRINAAKRVAPGWVQQITTAIRNDPSHPYKLEELSKLVGYHPVHIARTFREFTGKTVGEFVRCTRLELARTLLADNRLSIAEIAQMAGLTDQSHLNRLFRRCFNLTPQEVRRMQSS